MELLRYVVLHHTGIAEPHFDLMLEHAPGSSLATFRMKVWPPESSRISGLFPLGDHRRDYLDYEGPVSGNRGAVRRVATGTYRTTTHSADRWEVRLDDAITAILQPQMQNVIGIDIGGTTIKLALVRTGPPGQPHRIVRTTTIDTRPRDPGEECVRRIARAVVELTGPDAISGIGVGCPGLINNVTGEVVTSANLPSFRGFALGRTLQDHLNQCPVAVQNDANAAALGEFEFGASARGCKNMILLTLGTGVGGGVIADGRLLTGADNAAAEVGHVKVEYAPDAPKCGCGGRGCVETYAGIAGVARIAAQTLAKTPSPRLTQSSTTREITDAAKSNDPIAKQILETVGLYLGRAIASFIDIFNPEKVILAGGASRATEFLRAGIDRSLREYCSFPLTRDRTRIEPSALPDDINVLGAAAVFLNSRR